MEEFNHLGVLISIVLGLGITQLLSGFGRWLEQRDAFRVYAPSILWAAVLLLMHVQAWWSMFGMRDHDGWTFLQFALVLMHPIILFLLATLVLPSPNAAEQDLRGNYYKQRRWFFGLLGALLVVSVLKDVSLDGSLPEPLNLGFHVVFFISAVTSMAVAGDRFHRVLAWSTLVFIGAYILLLFANLA